MITDINSEDRLVQKTFADHLHNQLGWESIYAFNDETFGPNSTLGRANEREVVLVRDLRAALERLNPAPPPSAIDQAIQLLTQVDFARSLVQHNREFYNYIRDGVPISYQDAHGELQRVRARVIDFRNAQANRFLAVRELKIQGVRMPYYNRRADLVCFINGLPLVFIELKAVYRNIREGFDNNLTDYLSDTSIAHAFHHNAFLVVSNGDHARYGSITSQWEHFLEWKRNDEKEPGRVDAEVLLNGMFAPDRLLDLVENFILFDESKPGGTRKIVARNHQVLGVNNAVASVQRQEELKKQFPIEKRLQYRLAKLLPKSRGKPERRKTELPLVERVHPDLGRLGVFWHTQGSGKSYSMAFFAEKVRRVVPGNFTFLLMTDREDLDDQIWRTFVGCGIADDKTPRAESGHDLKDLLDKNHRFIFSLIHKFNQRVSLEEPYSRREDIIVISDEAHRTQSGKFARNMRLALPNASFIGFTGTPLFKFDHLTRRIFGDYVSRYDFKRSEEDASTVKLIYENRGEKLKVARPDLNDRIAKKIEDGKLDADQVASLDRLLGKDYEVITADERLEKIADDFVAHCSARWESGKAMLVCIDKITCGRMYNLILPRWKTKIAEVIAVIPQKEADLAAATSDGERERIGKELDALRGQADWMASTIVEIIISEGQNEVRDFKKWNVDIIPHRYRMKRGFETPDGKRVDVETAFKNPQHPFRIAIVCAMWLTGFDVECLSTLYIDKPMKAHTLMQAIARANRVFPGKDCGVIVDYNGMLKSLREALAQYALGDGEYTGNEKGTRDARGGYATGGGIIAPIEELLRSLDQAIDAAENHLRGLGFEPSRLIGAQGFDRIEAMRDATEALYTSDEAKRRFEIMVREVLARFRALAMDPNVFTYAERRDNLEAIYKKLNERRDTADVTAILKEIHKIVNEAIRTQSTGGDQANGLTVDLSQIDFAKLREEFAKRVHRKHIALQDIRDVVEAKLQQMLARNPTRMDYYKRYQQIIAEYNREKDRATVEDTFAQLTQLAQELDVEQQRAAREGLSDDELALFDLLYKDNLTQVDREKLKQASQSLLALLKELVKPMPYWAQNTQTQAEVESSILDWLYQKLPMPPFTEAETQPLAKKIYDFVWQRSASGNVFEYPLAA
ncbi:MAG: type I restriction endonuclease subunit R [Chloroflexota bacterium]